MQYAVVADAVVFFFPGGMKGILIEQRIKK